MAGNFKTGNRFIGLRNLAFVTLIVGVLSLGTVQAGEWKSGPALNTARYGAASVVHNGYIYVLGGASINGVILNTIERYNPASGEWEANLASFQTPRLDAAAGVYNGQIYLAGGLDDQGEIIDSVEIYDPVGNSWISGEDLEEERRGHRMFLINGTLCTIGGFEETASYVNDIEYFDTQNLRWEEAASEFVSPRSHMFTAARNNEVFLFGGVANVPVNNGYIASVDLAWNFNWNASPTLQVARGNGATAQLGDSLFLIGGVTPGGASDIVEIYNFTTGQISSTDPFPAARIGMTAQTLNDTIYVAGGYSSNPNLPTSAVEIYVPTVVGIESPELPIPRKFAQIAGYPNPFNGVIKLEIELGSAVRGELAIYDITGRKINTLHRGTFPAGTRLFKWDGRNQRNAQVPSGVYFAVLNGGDVLQQLKMVYVK